LSKNGTYIRWARKLQGKVEYAITKSIILFALDNAEICSSRGISLGVRSLNIAWQVPQEKA
jgi:hypothetical protein